VTGVAVNCDGSEFGVEEVNFFTIGESVYTANCAACHGPAGGGGAGPALAGGAVLSTFSRCDDHVEWVVLGSAGWPEQTYGDADKPVGGGMPAFENILSAEELRSAVLYERVAFGGEELAVSESGCGLGDAAAEMSALAP
jgi:mono/diheme cytochrome c family protein